jgi:hypothetical protein
VIAAVVLISAGCRHLPAGDDVPAVLVEPTPAARAELLDVLRAALGGAPLTLADDALTRSSVLLIEREPRGPDALAGRTVEASVHRFELVLNAGRCELVRRADAWRAPLTRARCVPVNR